MDLDPALRPADVDHAPGAEYDAANRAWQGIPGVERTPDGTLWATWYSGGAGEGPHNYVLVVRSEDGGRTWSAPVLVVDPPGAVRAFDPCLWTDPLDRLWLFWAQENVKWDGRAGVWAVVNGAPADAERGTGGGVVEGDWSAPRRLCDGIMMNKPTVRENGDWLFPATRWDAAPQVSRFREALDLSPAAERRLTTPVDVGSVPTTVFRSRDYGQSVERLGGAQVPATQWSPNEHMLVEREDGRLWMLVRTRYGIGESHSSDGGRTWSPVRDTGLEHPASRFFVRRLRSGALLLVTHQHATERTGLVARVSVDDGNTWRGGLVVDERAHVSYPDATQAPDGEIHLVYDRERHGAAEILLATFREADAAAGRDVSGDVRARVQVGASAAT